MFLDGTLHNGYHKSDVSSGSLLKSIANIKSKFMTYKSQGAEQFGTQLSVYLRF